MDNVKAFLIETEISYKSEYVNYVREQELLQNIIDESENELQKKLNSIDQSYDVLSSSQVHNVDENEKILSLQNQIIEHKNRLEQINNQIIESKAKYDKIHNLNEEYDSQCKMPLSDIKEKLKFIQKIVKVDPMRAYNEIKVLIRDM
ncbi:MAG: hypothetical protein PUA49_06085 [Butyrivibrio sp.]|nr:hypothetical protein [Butyrivibrio sp.]